VISQAQLWAERVLREHETAEQRIEVMFQEALAKPPSSAQVERARRFLDQQASLYGAAADDPRIWTDLAHMLFNMKEFIYLN
jgi:hypothetical protein